MRLNVQYLRKAAAEAGDETRYSIAKRVQVSQSTVSRLFNGDCQPNVATQNKFRTAYGLSLSELMTDEQAAA